MVLHPEHLDDLRKSGLTNDTIKEAGIYSVCPGDISKINPDPRIKSMLAFPYPDCDGFTRYKLYPPLKDKDGHTQKYHQKKGTGSRLYIPPEANGTLKSPILALNIVEGEKKALRLQQEGYPTIAIAGIWCHQSNGYLLTDFKKIVWADASTRRTVRIVLDSDVWDEERGDLRRAAYTLGVQLKELDADVYFYKIPSGPNGEKQGVDDYLEAGHSAMESFRLPRTTTEGPEFEGMASWYTDREVRNLSGETEPIDTTKFKPLSSQELVEILGLTIKKDKVNKLVTFLCELSAYTEHSQSNTSFNAPSSTGKSYIPTEIAQLFPEEDVIEVGYCSPTAFFHDVGKYKKEKEGYIVDLSRKILIFLDQPHTLLLQHLRPLLSHDKKEIRLKITDKTQKAGLRTKNIFIKGFPAVIFCTAGIRIDEQEATRFFLLSPEVNQEKIRQGIQETIKKEADNDAYKAWLEENPVRKLLKQRILAIKQENVKEVKIPPELRIQLEERFFKQLKALKPRHQRDIKRLISLIKSFALLNFWHRKRNGSIITANEEDVEEAFKIWEEISTSQELNLSPYVYNLFQEVILPAWKEKNEEKNSEFGGGVGQFGLSRQEILERHFEVYGRMLDTIQLRQQILPMLEVAGLITQEQDPSDKRKTLVYPTVPLTISDEQR
ncbi:MAG: DUF3854 domain-containing protein [Candidatus Brocadiales bacterium]